jgi:uncharacterized protein
LVQARPDIATLALGATTRRETPAQAFDRAEELAERLLDLLAANGVAAEDVRTTSVSLGPESVFDQSIGQSRVVGWRATHFFSVKVRDFSRIGPILDAAVTLLGQEGSVQGISFSIEDTNILISRARAEAFANARRAAEDLARQAGMLLGDVLSMEETFTPSPTPVQADQAAAPTPRPPVPMATPAAQRPETFEPGTFSVRVFVVVVFELVRPLRP